MRYEATPLPGDLDLGALLRYLTQEFQQIAQAMGQIEGILLEEMHAAPSKPRTGLIVLADGTDWNPGAGQGVYCYYNSTWNRLG